MRIVLLGAPGSGKGTQAGLLAERYKTPQISTGDLLRGAVASGSALGRQAKLAMDAGLLVGDDIVLGVIQERILRSDARSGFILDGFPRSLQQAEALDHLLTSAGRPLDLALLLAVDVDALLQRLVGRRTCLSCGQACNVFYSPPHIDGRCDACGGKLRHRADDNEETIGNRLRTYETQTFPVIDYYKAQGKLRTVQGVGEISTIFKAVRKVVDDVNETIRNESRTDAIRRAIARQQVATDTAVGKQATVAPSARPASAKSPAPGAAPKKAAAGKAAPKAAVSKKAIVKKVTTRKTAAGKMAPKKAAPKKSAPGSATSKRAVPRKAAVKKSETKPAALKKKARKRTSVRKPTSK